MYIVIGLSCLACTVLSLIVVLPASYALSIANITPRPPIFTDMNGQKITTTETGRQVIITHTFRNEIEREMNFLGLIEVRDESGVTVFIGWQTGTIPASNYETSNYNNSTMGFAWLPKTPSTYEARTFAITNLEDPEVLSHVEVAYIEVT